MGKEQKEIVDEINELDQSWATCSKCGDFVYMPNETFFDEHGTGYSTKLTHCTKCNKIVIVKHIEDNWLSKLNTDDQLYD